MWYATKYLCNINLNKLLFYFRIIEEDIKDFLIIEEDIYDNNHIRKFLNDNKLYNINRKDQIVKTARLVSQIPYGKGRSIEDVLVTKKVGVCTGKHLVLESCYKNLGIECSQVVCTYYWGEQGLNYPKYLQSILDQGEYEQTHNFLKLRNHLENIIEIDITWNPKLSKYGFKVLPDSWDGETSFYALKINKRYDNIELKSTKINLIKLLSPELRERRMEFLDKLFEWINQLNNS